MRKHLLLLLSVLLTAISVNAQAVDTNPGHAPDVVLDNHRPLIKKKDKAPTSRTVSGKVVDENGQPIDGALVTLTNTKTNEKTQVTTKKGGRYNFEDVSFDIDYQLQARYKGQLTEQRKLSQYDRNAVVVRILELVSGPDQSSEAKKEPPSEPKK